MWQETRTIFLEALADVLRAAARLLPSVLAMLLFILVAAAAAFLVRWLVHRVCDRLGLDKRLREWGVATRGAMGRPPPSRLVARVSFWTVLLAGALFALSVVDAPGVSAMSLRLVQYLPRAVLALAIMGAGIASARYVERSVLIGSVNVGLQSAGFAALGARWLIIVFAAAVSLEQAGVGTGVVMLAFGTLFGGIVLALALAVGLGAKDLVARSLERRLEGGQQGKGEPSASGPGSLQHL